MAAILRSRQTCLWEVIPQVEYAKKIAMTIADILIIYTIADIFPEIWQLFGDLMKSQ